MGQLGLTWGSPGGYLGSLGDMMHICSGLVGPKSENVEKPLVFVCFFEGQSGGE